MTHTDNRLYDIALGLLDRMTPARATELAERMPGFTPASVFTHGDEALRAALGGALPQALSRHSRDKALAEAELELKWADKNRVRVIGRWSELYPRRLRECDDAPICIYALGDCDPDRPAVISIVGTRRATAYGVDFVDRAVAELTERLAQKPLIISGLALGIDISAHRASLKSGAPTAAIMATPLNNIYPACHRNDAARIIEHGGMLITEYRSSDAVHRGNFLARNRIVAGMADVTIVVESDLRGGALCTARLAADYNRQVGAVPGRTGDRYSRGCNDLIVKQQAAMVRDAEDIIQLAGWPLTQVADQPVQKSLFPELDPIQTLIYEMLTVNGDMHQSAIFDRLDGKIPFHTFIAKMTDMEFCDIVMKLPGGHFRVK